jgi:chromosome segregation ATPase
MNMIEQFKEISGRYREKIAQLETETKELRAQRESLETQYENMIAELVHDSELSPIEDAIAEIDAKIAQTEKMLAIVKRGRSQKLIELIPGVKSYRDREKERIQQEFDEQLRSVMKMKAQYLMELRKLAEISAKVEQLNADVRSLQNEAGDDSREFDSAPLYRIPFDAFPAYVGTEEASKALSVPRWLIDEVIVGRLPQWIQEETRKRGGKR